MNHAVFSWIHPDGWRFLGIFAGITVLLSFVSHSLTWVGAILTLWCAYFFRNPPRVIPSRNGLIVSPADGKIVKIEHITPPANLGLGNQERYRISIFLNVFDVHVNRIPFPGIIERVMYHQGQFLNASLDKASDLNERNLVIIQTDSGEKIGVVQVAGLIARRIRCDVRAGDSVGAGQVYGLIRFGSRADVYLPENLVPLVIEGQRVIAGETIIADFQSTEDPRQGILI